MSSLVLNSDSPSLGLPAANKATSPPAAPPTETSATTKNSATTNTSSTTLPPLSTTKVPLGDGISSVTLVHLLNPQGGVFSQKKKQCDLWEFVWGTSLLFCRLLHRLPLNDTISVLEVGCGSALCGLTCALGGAHVLSSDSVEDAVIIAEQSANANQLTRENIRFEKRNWEKLEMFEEGTFDVVLGSDILFYRGAAPHVANVVARSLTQEGCALIADPVRLNVDDFCDRLDRLGCTTEVRQFENAAEIIDQVSALGQGKDAFVKLKLAKLVVVRRKSAQTINLIVNAVMEMTEEFVDVE